MKDKTCCFTGHRKLPTEKLNKITDELEKTVIGLIADGYRFFGTGGALGFDTVAAQSTAFARSNSLGMSLGAMTSDLEIEVTYVDFNGDDVYRTMTVSYENAEPKLSLKRPASATSAAQGEKIRLTYILKNEGNVPLVDLQLYDDMEEIGQIYGISKMAVSKRLKKLYQKLEDSVL